MASKRIKGITIAIGGDTTGLSQALDKVDQKTRDIQGELREVERLLKLDPKNTELLAQKQKLLADAVAETKSRLDTLKTAEAQVQAQFKKGDATEEQYRAVQREIIATEASLEKLEASAKAANAQMSNIGKATSSIASGATKLGNATRGVSTAAAGLLGAVTATVPATKELRSDLSKLDANAEGSAVSVDKAREAWRLFAAQTGETDSAVEAVSNLLQAGFTESDLEKAVEGLAGAALKFPDTLKIESLADSLQETIATGAAIGQFGELLDRMGIGAEAFNERMAAASTEAERQQVALQALSEMGLASTYDAWTQNNEAMLANEDATLRFQEAMAGLAEVIMPAVTSVTELVAGLVEKFNNLDSGTQKIILTIVALVAAFSPLLMGIGAIANGMNALIPIGTKIMTGMTGIFGKIGAFVAANPMALIAAAVVALVLLIATKGDEIQAILQKVDDFLQNIFAKDWTEVFGPVLGGALNAFFDNIKIVWDGIKGILDGVIDFIQAVFAGEWEAAWSAVKDIFANIFGMIVELAKSPLNAVIGLVNKAINGINSLIDGINNNGLAEAVEGLGFNIPDIPKIPNIPMLARGGVLSSGSAIVGEAGAELLSMSNGRAIVTPLSGNTVQPRNINMPTAVAAPRQPIELTLNVNGRAFASATYDDYQAEGVRRGGSLVNA